MTAYDVIIIGAGASGVFMAYEFAKLDKGLRVCMIDKGAPIADRACPIDGKKIKSCIHCK
ncbi:MAG: NAD(P)/FAD-dependent oxidoreductase, partial [Ruminiclostridium sp.]|nr:NAD(P)/FAD-dependent oxidoreductase [Ruminiclostridium sp.]